jgi:hypothetical protein
MYSLAGIRRHSARCVRWSSNVIETLESRCLLSISMSDDGALATIASPVASTMSGPMIANAVNTLAADSFEVYPALPDNISPIVIRFLSPKVDLLSKTPMST